MLLGHGGTCIPAYHGGPWPCLDSGGCAHYPGTLHGPGRTVSPAVQASGATSGEPAAANTFYAAGQSHTALRIETTRRQVPVPWFVSAAVGAQCVASLADTELAGHPCQCPFGNTNMHDGGKDCEYRYDMSCNVYICGEREQ